MEFQIQEIMVLMFFLRETNYKAWYPVDSRDEVNNRCSSDSGNTEHVFCHIGDPVPIYYH